MKKTILTIITIAISTVITIAILGYICIAWHTGIVIEKELYNTLPETVAKFNNAQNIFKLNISHSNHERHLFSTKTHIYMTLTPKDGSSEDVLTLADKDFTIHHGPFPIAALKQGIFSPQQAWIDYEISQEAKPALWEAMGNQPFITGYISLDYSNNLIMKLFSRKFSEKREFETNINLEYELGNGSFTFISNNDSPIPSITLDLDRFHTKKANVYFTLDKLHIEFAGEKQSTNTHYLLSLDSLNTNLRDAFFNPDYDFTKSNNDTFLINNLKVDSTIDSNNQNITLQANLDKFTLIPESDDKRPAIKLNKISVNQKVNFGDSRTLNGFFSGSIYSILYGQQELGKAEINIDYQGLDKAEFGAAFIDEDTQYNQPINSRFELKKLNLHNDNGDINIKGLLDVTNLNKIYIINDPLDNINNFTLHVNAPLNVLARTFAQYHSPNNSGITEEQFNKSKKIVQDILAHMSNDSPLFTFSKDGEQGLFIDILQDSNDVNINGKIYNKSDVLELFK